MKSESLHEWKLVSSVFHCLGISSWLLTHCACSKWQTFGWWDYSLELSLRCGSGDCMLESIQLPWLYTQKSPGLLPLIPAVQECKRHQDALAGLWPRADPVLRERNTRYTSLSLKYNFSSKVKVFFEALQEAWLGVLFCLFWIRTVLAVLH